MAHRRMEAIWKEKILRSYKYLVQDTTLYEVADSCFENDLIEDEQREQIMKLKTTSEKNRHFINLLLHQSQISYQNFLKCLTDEFDWIKERIEDTEVDSLPPSPGPKEHDIRRKIFRNYNDIVKNTTIYKLSDDLISERILEVSDWEKMYSKSTIADKNKQLLDALLRSRSHGYTLLMNKLEQYGYCDLLAKINSTIVNENIDKEIECHLRSTGDYQEKSNYEIIALGDIERHRADCTFVLTPPVEKGIEILEQHNILIYVGLPGDGKTKNAIAVMDRFQRKHSNYVILNICDVKTVPSCVKLERKNLVFLDDLFGSCMKNDDGSIEDRNTQYLATIQSYVRSGYCKIILTLRNTTLARYKERLKSTNIYAKKWAIDLTSSKSKLTKEFKRRILESYFQMHNITICKKKCDENYKTAANIPDCNMAAKIGVTEHMADAETDSSRYKTAVNKDIQGCKTAVTMHKQWNKYSADKEMPGEQNYTKKDITGYRYLITNENSGNQAAAISESTLEKIAAISYFPKLKTTDDKDATGFQIRISEKTVNKICETNSVIGFPQSCCMFCTKKCYTSLGLDYFKKPSKQLIKEIATMVDGKASNGHKLQYCIMAYMLLNGGTINPSKIDDGDELFEEVLDSVDLKRRRDYRDRDITDKLHDLTDVYICWNEDSESFVFKHQTILEGVAICFYDDNGELLLRHCSKAFIKDFVRPKTFKEKKGEVILKIKEKHYNVMVERFRILIASDNGTNRFKWWVGHPLFDHEKFVDVFCQFVQSDAVFRTLIQNCVKEGLIDSIDLFCQSYFAKQLRKFFDDVPDISKQSPCKKEKLRHSRSLSDEGNNGVTNVDTEWTKTVDSGWRSKQHYQKTACNAFKGGHVSDLQKTCYF